MEDKQFAVFLIIILTAGQSLVLSSALPVSLYRGVPELWGEFTFLVMVLLVNLLNRYIFQIWMVIHEHAKKWNVSG